MGIFLIGVISGAFAMMKWGDAIREAMGRQAAAARSARNTTRESAERMAEGTIG